MFMSQTDMVPVTLEDEFSRPVESIMRCEDFKSNFARRLSNRYISRSPVTPRADTKLKLQPNNNEKPDVPERIEPCSQLSKSTTEQSGGCVKPPNKMTVKKSDIRCTEVSALNLEVETLRWQLSQTEANRQMHIALLKQIVTFLSRVKEHIECRKPEPVLRKETMSARISPKTFDFGDLPRSRSVLHVNKTHDYSLSPTKKITSRKISKSINNVNGYKDYSGLWSQSKLALIPEIETAQKITEEMSRLTTLANTVLSIKLPDLMCTCNDVNDLKSQENIDKQAHNNSAAPLNPIKNDLPNAFLHNKIYASGDGKRFDDKSNTMVKELSLNDCILLPSPLTCGLENECAGVTLNDHEPLNDVTDTPNVTSQNVNDKRNDYHVSNFIEDESGFSSMSSFQEIGIPIISIIPPSPCKEMKYLEEMSDLLDDAEKWKTENLDIDKQTVKRDNKRELLPLFEYLDHIWTDDHKKVAGLGWMRVAKNRKEYGALWEMPISSSGLKMADDDYLYLDEEVADNASGDAFIKKPVELPPPEPPKVPSIELVVDGFGFMPKSFHKIVNGSKTFNSPRESLKEVPMPTDKPDQSSPCASSTNIDIVRRYTWKTKNRMTAQVITYGATITSIQVPDRNGVPDDVIAGFDTLEEYLQKRNPYFGATIGRYANTIRDGTMAVRPSGRMYMLSNNRGHHHYNGGHVGFDKVNWRSYVSGTKVIMSHVSERFHEGYPGIVMAQVCFEVTCENCMKIEMKCTTSEPTIINMSNAPYFNLAGHHTGPDRMYDHIITINADKFTVTDDDGIVTGEKKVVGGTPYDFRVPRVIRAMLPKIPLGGYDINYCVTQGTEQDLTFQARALHPGTGRVLEVYSNQPGMQFYTGNLLPDPDKIVEAPPDEAAEEEGNKSENDSEDMESENTNEIGEEATEEESEGKVSYGYVPLVGKQGTFYKKHGLFCLMPQNYPDAVNHKNFPYSILNPGEVYIHRIQYKFGILLGKFI